MMTVLNLLLTVSSVQAFAPSTPASLTMRSKRSTRPTAMTRRRPTTSLNVFDTSSTVNIANAIDAFYQTQPYAAAFVTCSVKASAADIVVQKNEDDQAESAGAAPPKDSQEFDLQRNLGFWLYGGLYQGMVQEYLYNNVFPSLFGDDQSLHTVLSQVAVDMVVLTPFLCLPVAYIAKATVAADEDLWDGLRKYWNHVQNEGLLVKYWSIWAPVQCITFGAVPHHLRIPWIALVSFFWLMILSNVSAREETVSE